MTFDCNEIKRRELLKLGGATFGSLILPAFVSPSMASMYNSGKVKDGARSISFRNLHTGESFSGVYRVGNKYLPDAFEKINYVLRDFRTDDVFPIDPRLIDVMYTVHDLSGSRNGFEIISGYRSPKTNTMLRKSSGGVAKKSYHMSGQAIDLRIPDFNSQRVRELAKSLNAGGVGYYRSSNFVHLDTGAVRSW